MEKTELNRAFDAFFDAQGKMEQAAFEANNSSRVNLFRYLEDLRPYKWMTGKTVLVYTVASELTPEVVLAGDEIYHADIANARCIDIGDLAVAFNDGDDNDWGYICTKANRVEDEALIDLYRRTWGDLKEAP